MPDYLAIITLSGGGCSYARDPDKDKAVKRAIKITRQDWGRMFAIPKNRTWHVPVYEVTGHPDVYWDASGVFDRNTQAPIPRAEVVTMQG